MASVRLSPVSGKQKLSLARGEAEASRTECNRWLGLTVTTAGGWANRSPNKTKALVTEVRGTGPLGVVKASSQVRACRACALCQRQPNTQPCVCGS